MAAPESFGFLLTKEFLELVLKKPVETFSTTLGTNPGDNYLSIMHAVDVTLKGEQGHVHLLVKCYPQHPARREYLDQMNVFEKELFMYVCFFPQLCKLSLTSGAGDKMALSLAPYHGGNVIGSDVARAFQDTPWHNENFLVMTDLRKTFGYKMADRIQGLDLAHTILVVAELAKLHALTWAYKQKHGLSLLSSKYKWFMDTVYTTQNLEQWKPLMNIATEITIKLVEKALGADHPICKSLQILFATDTLAIFRESVLAQGIDEKQQESYLRVKPKESNDVPQEPWLVGTHGDCWVNNILFRYADSDSSKPVQIALIDFQVIREACPTIDLAYFLFTSVRAPIRIKNENEILRVYLDTFTKHCEDLKVETLPGFTYETLQRRYRRSKLYGFLNAVLMLSFIFKPTEDCKNMDQQQGDNVMEMFSEEMGDAEENEDLKAEIVATVLNLYEEGVI